MQTSGNAAGRVLYQAVLGSVKTDFVKGQGVDQRVVQSAVHNVDATVWDNRVNFCCGRRPFLGQTGLVEPGAVNPAGSTVP